MGWRGVFYSLFFLLNLVESSTRSGKMWSLNLHAASAIAFSWPIYSASIFVTVAVLLSMYLIFEHLAAYNQPEVYSCSPLDLYLFSISLSLSWVCVLFLWCYALYVQSPMLFPCCFLYTDNLVLSLWLGSFHLILSFVL